MGFGCHSGRGRAATSSLDSGSLKGLEGPLLRGREQSPRGLMGHTSESLCFVSLRFQNTKFCLEASSVQGDTWKTVKLFP